MPDLVAGGECVDVTNQLIRFADIAADDPNKGLIDLTSFGELHDRDVETLFIDRLRICPEAAPADIHDMRCAGKEPDKHPVPEGRCHHGDIVQMSCPLPRVVGDIDVAFEHVLPSDPADEMRNSVSHGIHMTGRSSDGLSEHVALRVVDTCRQVAGFPH